MLMITFIVMIIYLVLLVWFCNSIYYEKKLNNEEYTPNVSVIIASRNEEKNLTSLFESLINQNYPINKYEIIIANDRSSDQSKTIIESYQLKYKNIHLIDINSTPLGWGNKKWALNQAIKASNSKILIQTDADCVPMPNWIQSMVSHFKNPKVGFVCGASPLIHSDPLLNNLFQMESLVQEAINAGAIKSQLFLSCTGRNIAFRKEYFNLVDGYIGSEWIPSGDDDLLLQKFALQSDSLIEYSIKPESLVESFAPKNFKDLLKQRLRFASKGIVYYKTNTTIELKYILVLLFSTNFLFIWSLFSLFNGSLIYLIPIFIKASADFFLSIVFMAKVKRHWSLVSYAILTVIHPFYMIIIGTLGPFVRVNWKKSMI